MKLEKKTLTLLLICILTLSTTTLIIQNFIPKAHSSDEATFTGVTSDRGVDTDSDGKYDFLEVTVQINVTTPGTYRIESFGLENASKSTLWMWTSNESYLDEGIHNLTLSFYGSTIYANRFNPTNVTCIDLYRCEGYDCYYLDSIYDVPLIGEYNYTDFNCLAYLTGLVHDEGVNTDGDELFDYLKIGVEVNVTKANNYRVCVNSLEGTTYVSVYTCQEVFLPPGIQIVNLSISGPLIFSQLHESEGNISSVSVSLSVEEDYVQHEIQSLGIPLSRNYAYNEFEALAYFTGKTFDEGVDTDGDGLFDYLQVDIEVNVTETGSYRISTEGLADESMSYLWYYHSFDLDLSEGVHMVNFTFPGEMIAYNHFNPTNITFLCLSTEDLELQHISMLPLSRRYNWTEFNTPMKDMELTLTVYPNATLGLSGKINRTRIYPPPSNKFLVNATTSFSTSENLTTATAEGTALPPDRTEWPWNMTIANITVKQYGDMLKGIFNSTVFMPPAAENACPFNSSSGDVYLTFLYMNRLASLNLHGATYVCPEVASEFPFNITDLTILADYINNALKGNVTFHALSGFPLGDVIVNFSGNESEVFLTGNLTVIYGNYSLFGEDLELNKTSVEGMLSDLNSSLPGYGEDSLYNMTNGMLECTQFNTTFTEIGTPPFGAKISYNVTIQGNFTEFLAYILASTMFSEDAEEVYPTVAAALNATFHSVQNAHLQLNYYKDSKLLSFNLNMNCDVEKLWSNALEMIPPTVPDDNRTMCEAWLNIANATAYAVENATINVTYHGTEKKLDVAAQSTVNITKLENNVIPWLPDAMPPPLNETLELYIHTKYCNTTSLNLSLGHAYGKGEFTINCTLEGDFEAEVNSDKRFYVDWLNITSPESIDWKLKLLNATDIDISNLKLTIMQGENWETLTFEGVKAYPPKNTLDFIRFKLHTWLSTASDDPTAPPREFQKLKVTIVGGSNATHTILLATSTGVPLPNATSLDYKSMTWENVTFNSLRDLLFKVAYQATVNYLGNTYYIPIFTNSTVTNFHFDSNSKSITFNVTGTAGTGFCNITIPRSLLYAAPTEWVILIDGVPLNPGEFNVTENEGYAFLYVAYSHSIHSITIQGTWVVTEFKPDILLFILTLLCFITALSVVKERKRLKKLRLKS